MEKEGERCLWPEPPPYYKDAANLTPPPIIDREKYPNVAVYDTPIFETWKDQLEALEKEHSLFFDSSNFGIKLFKIQKKYY